eukprot:557773-Pleurochrysis_carterae.AAC.5
MSPAYYLQAGFILYKPPEELLNFASTSIIHSQTIVHRFNISRYCHDQFSDNCALIAQKYT